MTELGITRNFIPLLGTLAEPTSIFPLLGTLAEPTSIFTLLEDTS